MGWPDRAFASRNSRFAQTWSKPRRSVWASNLLERKAQDLPLTIFSLVLESRFAYDGVSLRRHETLSSLTTG